MHAADQARIEYLRALAQQLDATPHTGRGAVIARAAAYMQCSEQTVYRRLDAIGRGSDRKTRTDKGDTLITEAQVRTVAAMIRGTDRQTQKTLMPIHIAISNALANNILQQRVSPETMSRLMRRFHCHPEQMKRASAHTDMRTLHPNHVWEVDFSICVLYRLPRAADMQVMGERRFYKNKLDKVVRRELLLRCLAVDHTTSAFKLRYYLSSGETAELVQEFLLWCMGQQEGQLMHGVPFGVYWDQGSGNIAHGTKVMLDGLAVVHTAHGTGVARATGSVEVHQNIIERHFEGRLAGKRVQSVEDLNALAQEWSRHFQSTHVHSRHGHTRWGLWSTIRSEHLRLRPSEEVCQSLVHSKPLSRKVHGTMTVSYAVKGFAAQDYCVRNVPGVCAGDYVQVALNPYKLPNVFVVQQAEDGRPLFHECSPVARDQNRFRADAPILLQEYGHVVESPIEHSRKAADQAAWGSSDENEIAKKRSKGAIAFDGKIDTFADVRQSAQSLPEHIARRGTPLDLPNQVSLVLRPLDLIDALQALSSRLNRNLQPAESAHVRALHPDGVPEDALPALLEQLRAGIDAPQARPALRLVPTTPNSHAAPALVNPRLMPQIMEQAS